MPREQTDAGGEIVWRAEYRAWGNTLRVEHIATRTGEPVYQPLRYQGSISMPGRVCTVTVSATMIRMRDALTARTRLGSRAG
ncbi:RHS domain-containing protein [Cronobacter dublinensis]